MLKKIKRLAAFAGTAALMLGLLVPALSLGAGITAITISPANTQVTVLPAPAVTKTFTVTAIGGSMNGIAVALKTNDVVCVAADNCGSTPPTPACTGTSCQVIYTPPTADAAKGKVVQLVVTENSSGKAGNARIALTYNLQGADCIVDSMNPGPQGSCAQDKLRCAEGTVRKCVAGRDLVGIGTWCNQFDHCNVKSTGAQYTCNAETNWCVGASAGVKCGDSAVNQDSDLGVPAEKVKRPERCDRGFVCQLDDNQEGECINDQGMEVGGGLGLGKSTDDIRDQIRRLINVALGFLGIAGVVIVIYGGFLWMSAMGDDEKVEKGKKTIVAGAIGLVIIGIAWTIVSYVLSVTQGVGR